MRKVRNQVVNTSNPALLFARGVESIIHDPLIAPSRNDREPRRAQKRRAREQAARERASDQTVLAYFYQTLLRQFASR